MSAQDKGTAAGHVMLEDYGSRVVGISQFAEMSTSLIVNAIDNAPTSVSSPFVIADYGCADGSQNMHIFSNIIKLAKHKYGEELPILVCHEDQEGNDFNSLFKWILGKDSANSYAAQHNNVFVMTSATGFYSQCFPPNFVNFGFSSLAVHWLSKLPTQVKNDVSHQLKRATNEEIAAFKHQAAIDWECFLLHRAKELKLGGQLVFTALSFADTHDKVEREHLAIVRDIWKSFVDKKIISEEEFQATNFPVHIRTVEEFKAPFEDPKSSVMKAGLRLVHMTDIGIFSPIKVDSEMTVDEMKAAGAKAGRAISAWAYTTFYNGLNASRQAEERKAIVDDLFAKAADSFALPENLSRYRMPLLAMHIQKCAE